MCMRACPVASMHSDLLTALTHILNVLPQVLGLEVEPLQRRRPLLAIIGGSSAASKLRLIDAMLDVCDEVCVGSRIMTHVRFQILYA